MPMEYKKPDEEYDVQHIITLLEQWGLTVEQHDCKTEIGGWYAFHKNRPQWRVQFNKFGVLMAGHINWEFTFGAQLKDRWFAGVIFAEVMA